MSRAVERASERIYRGLWGVLARRFRVPEDPPATPSFPGAPAGKARAFRPDRAFLSYLKFWFWIPAILFDLALVGGWAAITIALPWLGALLFVPMLVVAIVPDVVLYVALHLRYDTTWYVLTDRALRIRRGVWSIRETTITFENVQNVSITQGPVQRHFGISTVAVETAGAGAVAGPHGQSVPSPNRGLVEGIRHAAEVRDRIMHRVRASRSAGLGDERAGATAAAAAARPGTTSRPAWTRDHLEVLREIRDLVRAGTGAPTPTPQGAREPRPEGKANPAR